MLKQFNEWLELAGCEYSWGVVTYLNDGIGIQKTLDVLKDEQAVNPSELTESRIKAKESELFECLQEALELARAEKAAGFKVFERQFLEGNPTLKDFEYLSDVVAQWNRWIKVFGAHLPTVEEVLNQGEVKAS